MPLMKGCEATQIIRKELKNNIPIIALTANTLSGEKEKYLKKGMNGFITKPVNTNLLFTNMYELTSPEVLLQ
jgi:CheY-like chemotaxis protein